MNSTNLTNQNRHKCRNWGHQTICFFLSMLLAGVAAAQQASIKNARELLARGQLKEATGMLQKVVAADPKNAEARTLLGTTLALEGMRSESIEQLQEVVRLRPDSPAAYNTLGMVLSRFMEVQPAREAFEKSLQLDPNLAEARVNLALIQAQNGEYGPARENLDRAIQLQGATPAAAYTHYLRAKTWVGQKQTVKAAAELEIAVKLRPDFAPAWSDLGGARRLLGDIEGGQKALERAVALDPEDGTAQYRLGLVYLENREPHNAIEHFQSALRHEPGDRATLYNLALAYRRDGQEDEAKRVDEQLAKMLGARNKVAATGMAIGNLNDEGMALEKAGDVRGALEKYRAALEIDPSDEVLRLNFGLALCRLGRWQQGAAELQEVLRLDPNNAQAAQGLYIARDEIQKQASQQKNKD
jgi:tetratricopeptide (TPR) repeat protein